MAEFIQQVSAVLNVLHLTEDDKDGWEFVLVNDGSRDESLAIASAFALQDCRIRIVSFSRIYRKMNAGWSTAYDEAPCNNGESHHLPASMIGDNCALLATQSINQSRDTFLFC